MGNEQSGGEKGGSTSSPTASTGVPTSFSFLVKKRNSTQNKMQNSIVVVNEGAGPSSATTDPMKDPDLKRIKEIPSFLPLLRGVLPGYRDPPEVLQKIDHRHILHFLHRLQQHLRQSAQTVAAEQGQMFARVVEIDQLISSLLKKTAASTKKMDNLSAELRRMDAVSEQLESTQNAMREIVRSADSLNQLLPADDRLPPLQIAFTPILTRRRVETDDGMKLMSNNNSRMATSSGRTAAKVVDARKVSETRVIDRK